MKKFLQTILLQTAAYKKSETENPSGRTKIAFLAAVLLIGVSLLLKEPPGWQTVKYALLGVVLLAVSIIDYHTYIIPDELLAAALAVYVPLSALAGDSLLQIINQLTLHGILASVPLLLFVLLADFITGMETMGFGDIKLLFVLGVYLGAPLAWLTLFLACIVALVWNVLLLRQKKSEPFPFGPSISAAAWMVVLWGQPVLEWYIRLWM